MPPDRLGQWVDAQEQIAQAGGGGGQAIQVADGLGLTPTSLPGQFRSPFPPASFPVASPTRLLVSTGTPPRLPGSPSTPPRLPGSPLLRLPVPGLVRPPVFSPQVSLNLPPDLPDLADSDHEGDEESEDEDENDDRDSDEDLLIRGGVVNGSVGGGGDDAADSEGVELNGNTSDYNEAEDGPGISSGRTVRRPASRPAGVVGPRARGGVGDVGQAAPILLGGAAPQQVVAPVQQGGDGAHPDQQAAGVAMAMEGKEDLRPFLDPVVPGPVPGPIPEVGDGWSRIDSLGVWECSLSPFRALENVPEIHREKWGNVMFTILRRLQEANTMQEETRALKWFLIAPQAFLREPRRGGKKSQSNSAVSARFDSVLRDDWGSVLALLQADIAATKQRDRARGRRRNRREDDEDESAASAKLRKTVLALLKRGQISRAVRRICSHGLANADDPLVQAALQAKYTERGRDLPSHVYKGQCLDRLEGLKEDLIGLDIGVAPGFGGLRNEHLKCLGEVWDARKVVCLEAFSLRYVNGDLSPWFYKVWGSVSTFPPFKNSLRDTLRPVGVKSSLVRNIHKKVVLKNRGPLTEFLEPEQLAGWWQALGLGWRGSEPGGSRS